MQAPNPRMARDAEDMVSRPVPPFLQQRGPRRNDVRGKFVAIQPLVSSSKARGCARLRHNQELWEIL